MALESKSLSAVPKWDDKQTSAGMHISKLEELLEYHDSKDVIDKVEMQNFPTNT